MRELIDDLQAELLAGEGFALLTVIDEQGSTPRASGARMIVRADGSISGSIGGGLLEATMMSEAVAAIGRRRSRVVAIDLDGRRVDEPAMLCGGRATVLVAYVPPEEPVLASVLDALADALRLGERAWLIAVCASAPGDTDVSYWLVREDGEVVGEAAPDPSDWEAVASEAGAQGWMPLPDGRRAHVELVEPAPAVLVCGAGHVAQALAPVAAGVGFRVVVMDDRPEFADARRFPGAVQVRQLQSFEEAFSGLSVDERSLVVIVTRGHQHDLTALVQALRTPARYVGLMASRAKRERMIAALLERGFHEADIQRIHSPIGLPIDAETPAELAISIVAELIQTRAASAREDPRARTP
jgi:xanthine dehydrogenase accessory factor